MADKKQEKLPKALRRATLKRVIIRIKPYWCFVVCSIFFAALSVASQLYIPILTGDAIDMMLGKGRVEFEGLMRLAVLILAAAGTTALSQWILGVCNNRVTYCVSRDLRSEAMEKIQTLPLSYLDAHSSGDIISRVIADVETFADGLLMGFMAMMFRYFGTYDNSVCFAVLGVTALTGLLDKLFTSRQHRKGGVAR